MKKNKTIAALLLSVLALGSFSSKERTVNALNEGFTATELASSETIVVDGTKDSVWDNATSFDLNTVHQTHIQDGNEGNANCATGKISVMYNANKFYLFAEITDSTKLNNVSAWDPFNIYEYDRYEYNTDYLSIHLDIKHEEVTNYDRLWDSEYNGGRNVVGHFELAAGAGELTYSADGTGGWIYDTSNENFTLSEYAKTHSTIYSLPTETGYTYEMEIDLSEAGVTDFAVGKTIGLYVGYWDRYNSIGGSWGEQSFTRTAFEWNNYEPKGPGWLPEVKFVNSPFKATRTNEVIGTADGVKDAAYNAANEITINHVSWENENASPATAKMNLLWDTSYLYVFVEVIDDSFYEYQEGTLLEHRDALELIIDLYHNKDYTGGYGGDYRGDKMCEGMYKIAAGVGQATVDQTVQGAFWWLYDDQKNNGSYASARTETGYTVEYKIALGKDALEYMVSGREIGIGVKIYDKHADDKDGSVTVLEPKNDGQHTSPANLSSVKLVEPKVNPVTQVETKASLAFDYSYSVDENGNYTHYSYDNISIMFGADVETSLFTEAPVSAGVYMVPAAKATGTIAEMVENNTFNGSTLTVSSSLTTSIVNDKEVYSVGGRLNVIADNVELSDDVKTILKTEVTAAVYFELQDGTRVVLQDKTYSVLSMTETYLELEGLTNDQVEAIKALNNYINL